ncbi:uncharacterized protein LOC130810187 [Amaranthus tricolor]|uniref:uncharacterized protein LOC130810187 n=1 Tax=Amaranthus tricolor TaxID=29722 RepID=UPI002585FD57|nr:uncharacterized protein LOC130810187 [Amaranthus tricolor]
MGSLMAGWDSPVQDPKSVRVMRNKSLTKERIEEYWKLKNQTQQQHLQAIISPPHPHQLQEEESVIKDDESGPNELQRSNSLPMIGSRNNNKVVLGKESELDLQHLRNCWWTRSNWAFLNEPPVIAGEVPKYKYAAQYHVATLASSDSDTRIISTT